MELTRPHHAIAISNFTATESQIKSADSAPVPFLELNIGDRIQLITEEDGWAFGYKLSEPSETGIFPIYCIAYPEIIPQHVRDTHRVDKIISTDIKEALQLWWPAIRISLCSESDIHFLDDLLIIMERLIAINRRVEADNLPQGELNALRKLVSKMIDRGANFLKLPMTIRDSSGKPYSPGDLSIIECFSNYVNKHKMLSITDEDKQCDKNSSLMSLLLDMKTSTLNLFSNAEYSMSLYDLHKKKFITEPFTFMWVGAEKKFEQGGAKCMFTYLDASIELDQIALVTRVARLAPIDSTSGTLIKKFTTTADKSPVHNCRQPIAFDIRDLRSLVGAKKLGSVNHHAILLNRDDAFDVSLEKWSLPFRHQKADATHRSSEDPQLFFSAVLLHGTQRQLMRRYSHLFIERPPTLMRAHQLLDVPYDSRRNELYVTILYGEFLTKAVDKKNIEVRLSLVDRHDKVIPGCFDVPGTSRMPNPTYCSYVYVNEDKPRWFEHVKIRLPNKINCVIYLRICLHVRRAVDKHKSEKGPFGIAYLKVVDNGEVIANKEHDPLVYKIDQSRYEAPNPDYLSLPSTKNENRDSATHLKPTQGVFSLTEKCSITLSTMLVSGRLPVNSSMRILLDYRRNSSDVARSLGYIVNSQSECEEELVRFSLVLIDTLFDMWDDHPELENEVFHVLVVILSLHEQQRFIRYRWRMSALAERITQTSAGFRIFRSLLSAIDVHRHDFQRKKAMSALRCLGWFATAVAQSNRMGRQVGVNCADPCVAALESFLYAVADMICMRDARLAALQNTAVKHLPEIISPLIMTPVDMKRFSTLSDQSSESKDSDRTSVIVCEQSNLLKECRGIYDADKLTEHLNSIILNCSDSVVESQKIGYINSIIKAPIFMMESCREKLLPSFLSVLLRLMEMDDMTANDEKKTETSVQCFKTLLLLIEKLFPTKEKGGMNVGTTNELQLIITICLRSAVRTAVFVSNSILPFKVDDARSYAYTLVITLLHHTTAPAFKKYIATHDEQKVEVILEMLLMVRDILNKSPFCVTWTLLNRETNRIVYQVLQYVQAIHKTLIDVSSFVELWKEYMLSLIAFIIHASKDDSTRENEDLVKNAMNELKSTWFMLSPAQKKRHIPSMFRDFLLVAITTRNEHGEIIKIICDMIMTEFAVSEAQPRNFNESSRELYLQLDSLIVQENKGHKGFRKIFIESLEHNLEQDLDLWELGGNKFVTEVDRVLALLFDYRNTKEREENAESRMRLINQLLSVYQDSDQAELAIRYVYTLYELHLQCGNYIEAANTLKIHAESVLNWGNDELPDYLVRMNRNRNCATERQLKAVLLTEIAELYERGELFEEAIHNYNKIMPHYERIVVDYRAMARISKEVGKLYDAIQNGTRLHPFYYLVGFFGQGFGNLNGKQFVYMTKAAMRLGDFCSHLKEAYPHSSIIDGSAQLDKIKMAPGRFLQVITITAVPNKYPFEDENVSPAIKLYYEHYHVQKFEYTRAFKNKENKWYPYAQGDASRDTVSTYMTKHYVVPNEEMPGILNFSQVVSSSEPITITPLQMAVNQMVDKNKDIIEGTKKFSMNPTVVEAGNLERQVLGICQAHVMGGIANYLPFFEPDLQEQYDEEEAALVNLLKELIIRQTVLVEYAVYVHIEADSKLHEHLVSSFHEHKRFVEKHIGIVEDSKLPTDARLEDSRRSSVTTMSTTTLNNQGTMTRTMKNLRKSTNNMMSIITSSKSPRDSFDSQSIASPASPSMSMTSDGLFSPSPGSRVSSRMPKESNVDDTLDRMRKLTASSHNFKAPPGPPPPLPERPKEKTQTPDHNSENGSQFGTLRSKTSFFSPKNKPLPPTPSGN